MEKKWKAYMILLRPNHYIKNLLVFLPLFFDLHLFTKNLFIQNCFGFVIINDAEKDRMHEKKRTGQLLQVLFL